MTDELTVTGIECYGHHGVFEHEKREGQPFVVDLTLGLDTRAAAATDDLRDTVDYGSLVAAVKAAVEADPVDPAARGRLPQGRSCSMGTDHGAQAGRPHRGHLRRRHADDHPRTTELVTKAP